MKESYLEGEILGILLHRRVTPSATNQSLCIKDCVLGVRGQLVLGSITNQTLPFSGKGHIGWGDAVSLVISDDLHTSIFEHSNTMTKKSIRKQDNKNKASIHW